MSKRTKILLLCLALLALLSLACNDWDGMDRSDWAWDGSEGDEPVQPTHSPDDVQVQIERRGRP